MIRGRSSRRSAGSTVVDLVIEPARLEDAFLELYAARPPEAADAGECSVAPALRQTWRASGRVAAWSRRSRSGRSCRSISPRSPAARRAARRPASSRRRSCGSSGADPFSLDGCGGARLDRTDRRSGCRSIFPVGFGGRRDRRRAAARDAGGPPFAARLPARHLPDAAWLALLVRRVVTDDRRRIAGTVVGRRRRTGWPASSTRRRSGSSPSTRCCSSRRSRRGPLDGLGLVRPARAAARDRRRHRSCSGTSLRGPGHAVAGRGLPAAVVPVPLPAVPWRSSPDTAGRATCWSWASSRSSRRWPGCGPSRAGTSRRLPERGPRRRG